MFFFFEIFGGNEIHFFAEDILKICVIVACKIIAFIVVVFCDTVIKTHQISAFLMWGQAVIYGDILSGFLKKEGNFCLVLAVPVGEVVTIPGKLLCEKGFCACSAGRAFFT